MKKASTYYIFVFIAGVITIAFLTWASRNYLIPSLIATFGEPTSKYSELALAILGSVGFWGTIVILIWIIWQIKTNQPEI